MAKQFPLFQHEEKARCVARRIETIKIVFGVERANVRIGDAFVGADDRADAAVEPDDRLLNGLALRCRR